MHDRSIVKELYIERKLEYESPYFLPSTSPHAPSTRDFVGYKGVYEPK